MAKTNDQIYKKLTSIDSRLKKVEILVTEEEKILVDDDSQELESLEELKKLEENIKKDVSVSPLTSISYRDFIKSAIGAFFGILGHFSFFYGVKIAEGISTTRATMLYIVAFLIGAGFLYFSGFRKINKNFMLHFIPLRLAIIYVTSISVIIIVLLLFNYINFENSFAQTYKLVSTISILAVMGAVTADLIGKKVEE